MVGHCCGGSRGAFQRRTRHFAQKSFAHRTVWSATTVWWRIFCIQMCCVVWCSVGQTCTHHIQYDKWAAAVCPITTQRKRIRIYGIGQKTHDLHNNEVVNCKCTNRKCSKRRHADRCLSWRIIRNLYVHNYGSPFGAPVVAAAPAAIFEMPLTNTDFLLNCTCNFAHSLRCQFDALCPPFVACTHDNG